MKKTEHQVLKVKLQSVHRVDNRFTAARGKLKPLAESLLFP